MTIEGCFVFLRKCYAGPCGEVGKGTMQERFKGHHKKFKHTASKVKYPQTAQLKLRGCETTPRHISSNKNPITVKSVRNIFTLNLKKVGIAVEPRAVGKNLVNI